MISYRVSNLNSQKHTLPADVAVRLPHGQLLGAPNAPVKLSFSEWASMARLKAGQIGALAEDYVEGKLQLEGSMRDIIGAVTRLLKGNPVASDSHWWSPLLRRAKSPHKYSFTTTCQMRFTRCGWTRVRCIHALTTATCQTHRPAWRRRKRPNWT